MSVSDYFKEGHFKPGKGDGINIKWSGLQLSLYSVRKST